MVDVAITVELILPVSESLLTNGKEVASSFIRVGDSILMRHRVPLEGFPKGWG